MRIDIREMKDKIQWNNFVMANNFWSLFQSWQWGEVQKMLHFQIRRLGLYIGSVLIGIAQVVVVRAKRGTYLHVRQGPIFKEIKPETLQQAWYAVLKELRTMASYEKAWFIRVNPLLSNTTNNEMVLRNLGFRPAPIPSLDAEVCWVLDLNHPELELLTRMRKTTRYLIRQAEKLGVTIEETSSINDFLPLYLGTANRHHFIPHVGLDEEFTVFKKDNLATLFLAKYQGKLLAGALILLYAGQAIYHHGASEPTKIPASYLLQWQAIQWSIRNQAKYYNFWGIADESKPRHPWRGITHFKKGFGGRELKFIHAHDLPLSPYYVVSYTIDEVRKAIKGF